MFKHPCVCIKDAESFKAGKSYQFEELSNGKSKNHTFKVYTDLEDKKKWHVYFPTSVIFFKVEFNRCFKSEVMGDGEKRRVRNGIGPVKGRAKEEGTAS